MRIVYLGSPDFAVLPQQKMAAAGWEIAAVFSQPDRARGKRGQELLPTPVKSAALALGIPVYTPGKINTPETLAQLRACQPDLLVVVAYGQLLGAELLAIPPLGAINIHASLLPRYRGAAPLQRALLAGERTSGATIMYLDQGMDSGEIILQQELAIGENETFGNLHDRVSVLGTELLLQALSLIAAGQAPRFAQDEKQATFAPKLAREEELIDWQGNAAAIHNRVRALDPLPGAYALHRGKRLKLFGSSLNDNKGQPGEILAVGSEGMTIACGQSSVTLNEVQPEGKGRMPATAFARGYQIEIGGIL
jgi:methionyl-tRNA formyltransferase